MSLDTLAPEAQSTYFDTPDPVAPPVVEEPVAEEPAEEKPKKAPTKKAAAKKPKTMELTLTVTGTADGEWRAELKQGSTYRARNLAVAARETAAAAKELHEDLSVPIDELIEEARTQQAAKVAALEAELEAARKALSDLE